jgi:hypothetical protein
LNSYDWHLKLYIFRYTISCFDICIHCKMIIRIKLLTQHFMVIVCVCVCVWRALVTYCLSKFQGQAVTLLTKLPYCTLVLQYSCYSWRLEHFLSVLKLELKVLHLARQVITWAIFSALFALLFKIVCHTFCPERPILWSSYFHLWSN